MIKQENGKWVLYSKDGSKVLGTYATEEEAKAREAQVIAAVAAKGTAKEDFGMDMPMPSPVITATSFADLYGQRAELEAADEVRKLAYDFGSLAANVINAGGDVPGELQALSDEFMTMVMDAYQAGTAEAEPMPEGALQLAELAESAEWEPLAFQMTPELAESAEPSLLYMDVALIRPGWGNKKHGHYYPKETLKRDGALFEGMKMYETDHKPGEKNTRTWVSTITKVDRFADDGAPIARVAVHDPNFAARLRNLNEAGLLHKMECSILADGLTRDGTVEGKPASIVEAITAPYSVDWVTKAGAGGAVVALAESANEVEEAMEGKEEKPVAAKLEEKVEPVAEKPAEVTLLAEADVASGVQAANLPQAAAERLAAGKYTNAEALQTAIVAERDYIKRVTGSGAVTGQGGTVAEKKVEVAPLAERESAAIKRYLVGG